MLFTDRRSLFLLTKFHLYNWLAPLASHNNKNESLNSTKDMLLINGQKRPQISVFLQLVLNTIEQEGTGKSYSSYNTTLNAIKAHFFYRFYTRTARREQLFQQFCTQNHQNRVALCINKNTRKEGNNFDQTLTGIIFCKKLCFEHLESS